MRVLLPVTLVISIATTAALAEWRKITQTDTAVTYVDPNTITRAGSSAKGTFITNYNEKQAWSGYSFLSSKTQWEFDCSEPRGRVLVEDGYTGQMATSAATYHVDGPRDWRTINKETVGWEKRAFACGR